MTSSRNIGIVVGTSVLGPSGALIGGITGAVIDTLIPELGDFAIGVLSNWVADYVGSTVMHRQLGEQNHDLQNAFRIAVMQAVKDIGGKRCFPDNRTADIVGVAYLSPTRGASTLQEKEAWRDSICALLHDAVQGIDTEAKLPLTPLPDGSQLSAYGLLLNETSEAFATKLYDSVFPSPKEGPYAKMFDSLPDLKRHLTWRLFEQTHFHFGELLKSDEHSKSWIAFQRAILQQTLVTVQEGQRETTTKLERIERLLASPEESARLQKVVSNSLAVQNMEELADVSLRELTNQLLAGQQQQLDELKHTLTEEIWRAGRETQDVVRATGGQIVDQVAGVEGKVDKLYKVVAGGDSWRRESQLEAIRGYLSAAVARHDLALQWRVQRTMRSPNLDSAYVPQKMTRVKENFGSTAPTPDPVGALAQVEPLSALLQERALVVLGEPGSGKSIMLHHMALELARDCQRRLHGDHLAGGYLPILVPLAGFWGDRRWRARRSSVDDLLAHVDRIVRATAPSLDWRSMMTGRLAFLFDAYDEVAPDAQEEAIDGIQMLVDGIGAGCPIVVTSREARYQQSPQVLGAPFQVYRLALLQPAELKPAVALWMAALTGLGKGDAAVLERWTQALIKDVDSQPGLRDALRNPLRLWLTVRSFLTQDRSLRSGSLYEQYVDDALAPRKDSPENEPAWPDAEAAKTYLQEVAWRMQNDRTVDDVEQVERSLMQTYSLSDLETRRFVNAMQRKAGLLLVHEDSGADRRPDRSIVSFGPHQSFHDFFVGRYLAHWWKRDRPEAQRFLRDKAEHADWKPSIRFGLSLLAEDKAGFGDVFDFILEELAVRPFWGVWCLHEGLELHAASLPAVQRQQIYRQMSRQARMLLHLPAESRHLLRGLRYRSEMDRHLQFLADLETIQALAKLQLPESGQEIMQAMYHVASRRGHERLDHDLRTPLIDLDHRGLWPAIKDVLTSKIGWKRQSAALIVMQWRDPAALEAMRWLLETTEFTDLAIRGIALLSTEESEAEYRRLLDDPNYAELALKEGVSLRRPDVLDRAIGALEVGRLTSTETQRLIETIVELPVEQAKAKMAAILPLLGDETERWQWFKVERERQLPTLRVLVPLMQHDDPKVATLAQELIPAITLGGDLDPHYQDTQTLLEQILLNGDDEDRQLRDLAARQLGSTTLSEATSAAILQQLDNPTTSINMIRPLHHGLSMPEPYRRQAAARIQAELARGRFDRQYLLTILAKLDAQAAAQEMVAGGTPDDTSIDARRMHALTLVRLRSKDAYRYVMDLFHDDERWQSAGMAALIELASVLSPSQRREAAEQVKPMLQGGLPPERWTAVYTLGRLKARSAFKDLLAALRYGDPRQQEIVVGMALSELGSYQDLAAELDQAFASREGHICGAVVYAWGVCADVQAVNPLARTLFLPDDYLRSADQMDYVGDLAWACRDLRARAAFNLGWLAAGQGLKANGLASRFTVGWKLLLRELTGDHPLAGSGAATLLDSAVNSRDPAGLLYSESLSRRGPDQELFAALLGAIEWSQVLMHMLEGDGIGSLPTWETLRQLFMSSNRSDDVERLQAQLATRIAWRLPYLPLHYLFTYLEHRDEAVRKYGGFYFWREPSNWCGWVEWQQRYTILPDY